MGSDYILVLGRPNFALKSSGRSYFVSLVINDLSQLWSGFSDVMGMFDFEMLAVQVTAYDGTFADLCSDLKPAPSYFALEGALLPDTSKILAPLVARSGYEVLEMVQYWQATCSSRATSSNP
jgi:hypothetical protein